jgi:peptide deformylase
MEAIVQVGDPVLRAKAKPLSKKDITSPETAKLIAHMKKVLAQEKYGVAIAAPQVGASVRLFVVAGKAFSDKHTEKPPAEDTTEEAPTPTRPDMVFINPELLRLSKARKEMSEGCLSVRGTYGSVIRHEKASVRALDEQGKPFTYHGNGLIAEIFQHECDHLDGILYIDKAVRVEEDEESESAADKIKKRKK